MLLAILRAARADYFCPEYAPTLDETYRHFGGYKHVGSRLTAAGGTGSSADGGETSAELAEALWLYVTAATVESDWEAVQQISALARRLGDPAYKRRLQRQLGQLAGSGGQAERLLTAVQLQYLCCYRVIRFAIKLRQPTAEMRPELKAAAARSAETLRQLEPNNPVSHVGEAEALQVGWESPNGRQNGQIVEGYLRAAQLGQQQGSDYWAIHSIGCALSLAACRPLEVGHSTLAAALASFEQTAEAALRRCKRLLPMQWVRHLERQVGLARPLLPGVRHQLQLLQQASVSSGQVEDFVASVVALVSGATQHAVCSEQA